MILDLLKMSMCMTGSVSEDIRLTSGTCVCVCYMAPLDDLN